MKETEGKGGKVEDGMLMLKGHWTSATSSPTVGIFIPVEVLVWVMTTTWLSFTL